MRLILLGILVFISGKLKAQAIPCNITPFPSQMALDSDFQFTNNENNTVVVQELTLGWPSGTAPGVDNDSDHTDGVSPLKFVGPSNSAWIVTTSTTPLGVYKFKRDEGGAGGCIDTITVEVVTTLPVNWLKPINVLRIKNKHQIEFATAQQINNSHFEIERSIDGQQFRTLGQINGDGNSSKQKQYRYIDDSPVLGRNYYRIKQVDFDGKYSYSNIASALYETEKLEIYPNPVKDELILVTSMAQQATLYSPTGKFIKVYELTKGINKLNLSILEKGVYYLRLKDETRTIVKE